jgi:small redox-active disulfide protein 2
MYYRSKETDMEIKVLGSGCAKCNQLEEATKKAVAQAGIDASVEKVTDMAKIMGYGVMTTPALVVNDEVRVAGRVPSVEDIIALLNRA